MTDCAVALDAGRTNPADRPPSCRMHANFDPEALCEALCSFAWFMARIAFLMAVIFGFSFMIVWQFAMHISPPASVSDTDQVRRPSFLHVPRCLRCKSLCTCMC